MDKTNIQKITPHLWFDNNAEEAAKFYTTLFNNSKIVHIAQYGDAAAKVSGRPKGSVMTVVFELDGQRFMALNGGPIFKFSPAISFLVSCETKEEIDKLWEKLSEGREKEQCGW
ncbi:MAG: VOC family protein, partial [Nitrososphaera sp.]